MDQKLSRLNRLFLAGLFNQFTSKSGKLPVSHHPACHIAAEDIEDHIEIVIGPFLRSLEFGDIPGPYFIGALREELRLRIVRPG
ncbi:MAG: hypothetical protein A4E58_03219 [Syntrophorhabdus sp. PtaB.Bin006]|nr:MAG: hypothetical protein A4E58_03219 [Syntrophorhabdus sp. PtaB.Bin006]